MNILFIGDIVGRPGRQAVKALLPQLKEEHRLNLVFANGENLAGGKGMTLETYLEMIEAGINYFTSGNHIWHEPEFIPQLDDPSIRVLRPANYPQGAPGRGVGMIEKEGIKVQLINLIGRVFMGSYLESYFEAIDHILSTTEADIRLVDFHGETSSEKVILAYYLDGKVTALLGTHTHVPTADERILPKGTAFQTDVGMTGPLHSTLGAEIAPFLEAARTGLPPKYEVASGPVTFNATLMEIGQDYRVKRIERIQRLYSL